MQPLPVTPAVDRDVCPACQKVIAVDADYRRCPGGCTCERCTGLCWLSTWDCSRNHGGWERIATERLGRVHELERRLAASVGGADEQHEAQ